MIQVVFRRGGLTVSRGPDRMRITARQPLWQAVVAGAGLVIVLSALGQWISLTLHLSVDLWLMTVSMAPLAGMLAAWLLWRRRRVIEVSAEAVKLSVTGALRSRTQTWVAANVLRMSASGAGLVVQLTDGSTATLLDGRLDPAAVAEAAQMVDEFRARP